MIVDAQDVKLWSEQQKHDVKTWLMSLGVDPNSCYEIHRVDNEVRFRIATFNETEGEPSWLYSWTDWRTLDMAPAIPSVLTEDDG